MSQIILVVDRIEGDTAVLELGDQLFDVPLAILPLIKEGDQVQIVRVDNSNALQEAQDRLERLRKRDPDPDDIIDL